MQTESDTEQTHINTQAQTVSSNINPSILAPYLAQIQANERGLLERLWADLHEAKNDIESINLDMLDESELIGFEEVLRITAGFLHFTMMASLYYEDQRSVNSTALASFAFQIDCHVKEVRDGFRRGTKAQSSGKTTVRIR